MKKVLFVINTMGRAGAEKSMTELMKVFDTNRYELHLLVLINRGEMYDEVPSYVKIHNKNPDNRSVLSAKPLLIMTIVRAMFKNLQIVREMPYLSRNFFEQYRNGRIQYDKLFWKLISDTVPKIPDKFDVAIAYLEGGAAYYVADHVDADKKAAFIHIDYKNAGYTPLLDHGCYKVMDKIYMVSEDAKKSFLEIYPKFKQKVHLFHNIINGEAIRKAADEGIGFEDNFDGIRILTIARLHYQKAIDLAIKALADLRKEGYNVKWYVIGEGSLRAELERMIEEYQVNNNFILLGSQSNPYPYLKKCDLYVHVTRFEGKSIAIQEAQVLGKAIIVSDCSGNRDQIKNEENGLIVKLDNDEIVKGIKRVVDDRGLRNKFELANKNLEFDYSKNLEPLYQFIEGI